MNVLPADISQTPTADLIERLSLLNDERAMIGAEVDSINEVIANRYLPVITETYEAAGKLHGKVDRVIDNRIKVVADISKFVKWDNANLQSVAAGMDWAVAQHLFKITFSVSETVFNGLAPDDPRKAALEDARTVVYGKPKLSLVDMAAE